MENVNVIINGQQMSAKKIRYINYGSSNYLIYTLNEKDEDGYVKLFINKIVNNEEYIISDFEWDGLKSFIPTLVREIRANTITSFDDLEIDLIDKINIDNARAFKLKEEIVNSIIKEPKIESLNLLGQEITQLFDEKPAESQEQQSLNKLEEFLKNPVMEEPEEVQLPIKPKEEKADLSVELRQAEEEIERLQKEKEELENEIEKYREKLENIRAILD